MKTVLTIFIVLFAMNIFGQGKIFKRNPNLLISDVKFLDEENIIKVGLDGIYKSTNGGDDWVNKWTYDLQNPEPIYQFSKIFFYDNTTGWIFDKKYGTIFRTQNAGEDWEIISELGPGLNEIYFTSSNIGWAVFSKGQTAGKPGKVMKTTNGGIDWSVVINNDFWNYNSISFSSPDNGWIAAGRVFSGDEGGRILNTTDGGETWLEQESEIDFWIIPNINFIDDNNGWLIAEYFDPNISRQHGIFNSTDGGVTWVNQYNFPDLNYYALAVSETEIKSTYPNNIWVVGEFGEFNILKTSNGGIGWEPQIINELNDYHAFDFIDNNRILAVGYNTGIAETTDGGNTWIEQKRDITNNFNSVSFVNSNTGFIVGDDGIILKSTDGGIDWKHTASPLSTDLNSVYFINENLGWAAGSGSSLSKLQSGRSLIKTTNGGSSWDVVINNNLTTLNSIFFIDENIGWAVGDEGTILKTENAGVSWSNKTAATDKSLRDIYFADQNNGWIAGDNATIQYSSDGGETWELQSNTLPTLRDLTSLHFIDTNNGWVISDGGDIAKTTDGGNNWSRHFTGSTHVFNSIHFSNELNGWAAGREGKLYQSTDGGESWNVFEAAIGKEINDLIFTDEFNGYAVGNDGSIFNYNAEGFNSIPEIVNLVYPEPDDKEIPIKLEFEWKKVVNAESYKIQIAEDSQFNIVIFENDFITNLKVLIDGLTPKTKYYWRVAAANSNGTGSWSQTGNFTTRTYIDENWEVQNSGSNANLFTLNFHDENFGVITSGSYSGGFSNQIIKTTNGGTNWIAENKPLNIIDDIVFYDDETGLASITPENFLDEQFASTTDGGITWTKFGSGYVTSSLSVILPSKNIGYSIGMGRWLDDDIAVLEKIDLVNSTILGISNPGFGREKYNKICADFVDENMGWVVGHENYDFQLSYKFKRAFIYKTENAGSDWDLQFELEADWDSLNADYLHFYDIDVIDEKNIWVCGNGKNAVIMNSSDGGLTWQTKYISEEFYSLSYPVKISFYDPKNGFVIMHNISGDYLMSTSDGGETWHSVYLYSRYTLNEIQMVNSTTGYVVGNNGLVLKFQDSTTVVGIGNNEENLPTNFELAQNYPNPFNPETKIKFSLPKNSKVVLEVYNVLGQKVRELVNTDLPAGYHEVNFNSRGLASGVYIYRFQADDQSSKNQNRFMEVKKMILLK